MEINLFVETLPNANINDRTKPIGREITNKSKVLLHAAEEFKMLFPDGSQGGKASSLIWEDRETFDLFNDNFIESIENISISIENEDSVSLMENFNIMASNCGTCHKKFRN